MNMFDTLLYFDCDKCGSQVRTAKAQEHQTFHDMLVIAFAVAADVTDIPGAVEARQRLIERAEAGSA